MEKLMIPTNAEIEKNLEVFKTFLLALQYRVNECEINVKRREKESQCHNQIFFLHKLYFPDSPFEYTYLIMSKQGNYAVYQTTKIADTGVYISYDIRTGEPAICVKKDAIILA